MMQGPIEGPCRRQGPSPFDLVPDIIDRSTSQPEPGHGWSRAAYIDAPGLDKGAGLKMVEVLHGGSLYRNNKVLCASDSHDPSASIEWAQAWPSFPK